MTGEDIMRLLCRCMASPLDSRRIFQASTFVPSEASYTTVEIQTREPGFMVAS